MTGQLPHQRACPLIPSGLVGLELSWKGTRREMFPPDAQLSSLIPASVPPSVKRMNRSLCSRHGVCGSREDGACGSTAEEQGGPEGDGNTGRCGVEPVAAGTDHVEPAVWSLAVKEGIISFEKGFGGRNRDLAPT